MTEGYIISGSSCWALLIAHELLKNDIPVCFHTAESCCCTLVHLSCSIINHVYQDLSTNVYTKWKKCQPRPPAYGPKDMKTNPQHSQINDSLQLVPFCCHMLCKGFQVTVLPHASFNFSTDKSPASKMHKNATEI